MAKVAFIGLGVMGYPMAGHLKKRGGHDVTVYNRSAARAEKWTAEHGGRTAPTPKAAATGADFVFTCVGNDDDLRSVVLGDSGALASMKAGAVLIDNTTASALVARELAAAAKGKSVGFLDAPVSGGQAGAENGQLTVMVGGDEADFARAKPVIDAYAKMVGLMGPTGAGQLTKMVNQICIAGLVQGLSEGVHFAKHAGLDVEKVIGVISKGAAQSWQIEENRYKTMNAGKFDFGFAVDWMRKDLDITLTEARANGAKLPVTALVDQFYAEVQAMGGKRWDTSSLIARLDTRLMAKPPTEAPRVEDVLAELKALGSEKNRAGMARFGINTDKAFGVSIAAMAPLVRKYRRNHALAGALWASGYHEARILAAFVEEPDRVGKAQMNAWAAAFDSWDVCDQVSMRVFARTPYVADRVTRWAVDEREFVRRAAFATIAGYAVAAKDADDAAFLAFLPLIAAHATNSRNFVRKAVNWALRQIGKRSTSLRAPALALARKLAASGDKTARWIGTDAARELSDPVQIARIEKRKTVRRRPSPSPSRSRRS